MICAPQASRSSSHSRPASAVALSQSSDTSNGFDAESIGSRLLPPLAAHSGAWPSRGNEPFDMAQEGGGGFLLGHRLARQAILCHHVLPQPSLPLPPASPRQASGAFVAAGIVESSPPVRSHSFVSSDGSGCGRPVPGPDPRGKARGDDRNARGPVPVGSVLGAGAGEGPRPAAISARGRGRRSVDRRTGRRRRTRRAIGRGLPARPSSSSPRPVLPSGTGALDPPSPQGPRPTPRLAARSPRAARLLATRCRCRSCSCR